MLPVLQAQISKTSDGTVFLHIKRTATVGCFTYEDFWEVRFELRVFVFFVSWTSSQHLHLA